MQFCLHYFKASLLRSEKETKKKYVAYLLGALQVSFDELRIHPLFKNDESPFGGMEQAELITIHHRNGMEQIS